jgi:hypothetical protein
MNNFDWSGFHEKLAAQFAQQPQDAETLRMFRKYLALNPEDHAARLHMANWLTTNGSRFQRDCLAAGYKAMAMLERVPLNAERLVAWDSEEIFTNKHDHWTDRRNTLPSAWFKMIQEEFRQHASIVQQLRVRFAEITVAEIVAANAFTLLEDNVQADILRFAMIEE